MRNFIVLMLLAVASSGTAAEWVKFGRGAASDVYDVYIDPATIRRNGDMAKMWSMYDYKTAKVSVDGKAYLSTKQQSEYDCKDERSRQLHFTWRSGNKGSGYVVYADDDIPTNWIPVSPGSVSEDNLVVACGKLWAPYRILPCANSLC